MHNTGALYRLLLGAFAGLVSVGLIVRNPVPDTDWPEYNGDGQRSHYLPLDQITPSNVQQLRVAWTYASGLTAIDLNTGAHKWQVPLGDYPELTAKGISPTGMDNYGGPLVTGSGLLFVAASKDGHLWAIDKKTGKISWQTTLPTAGYDSPTTYTVGGKQYIVIACGGGKLKGKSDDRYVAYALDE